MKTTLSHSVSFYAQHAIKEFPQQHGHAYRLTVSIVGAVEGGMVMPLDELGRILAAYVRHLPLNLNDILERPTLENLGLHLYEQLRLEIPIYRLRLEREGNTDFQIEVER